MDGMLLLTLFGVVNIGIGFGAGWILRSARAAVHSGSALTRNDIAAVTHLVENIEKSTAVQMESWEDLRQTLENSFVPEDLRPHVHSNHCFGQLLQVYHERITQLDPHFRIVSSKFADFLAKTRWAVGELTDELREAETRLETLDAREPLRRLRKLEESNRCLCEELAIARKQLAEQAQQLQCAHEVIFEDYLTKLHNRRAFDLVFREFNAEFARSGRPFCLLLMDFDHLKRINERHGSDAGDAVLAVAAKVVRNCCSRKDHVMRYGDDEFLVLTPTASLDAAGALAERIRSRIEAVTVKHQNAALRITCSIGVAQAAPDCTGSQLLAVADELLYAAKDMGRNNVRSLPSPAVLGSACAGLQTMKSA